MGTAKAAATAGSKASFYKAGFYRQAAFAKEQYPDFQDLCIDAAVVSESPCFKDPHSSDYVNMERYIKRTSTTTGYQIARHKEQAALLARAAEVAAAAEGAAGAEGGVAAAGVAAAQPQRNTRQNRAAAGPEATLQFPDGPGPLPSSRPTLNAIQLAIYIHSTIFN